MYTFFVHFCNKAVNTAILPLFSARDDWILRAYYVIVLSECNTDASEPCSFRAAGDPKSFDAFTKGFIFERRKNMNFKKFGKKIKSGYWGDWDDLLTEAENKTEM